MDRIQRMQAGIVVLLLSVACLAGAVSASGADDPNNCKGVGWDDRRPLSVARVTAPSRVYFLKSPYDSAAASSCPADKKICRKKTYLVSGDLVLVGQTQGDFTCVDYQSPQAKKQIWIRGWLPSAALTPVAPTPSPETADWIGRWRHPGGFVEIKNGDGGKLRVEGSMTLPTPSGDFQNGDFLAQVADSPLIAFTDEGVYGDLCHVRMQRIGSSLLVEDNGGCGGSGVTFTGLYRR